MTAGDQLYCCHCWRLFARDALTKRPGDRRGAHYLCDLCLAKIKPPSLTREGAPRGKYQRSGAAYKAGRAGAYFSEYTKREKT